MPFPRLFRFSRKARKKPPVPSKYATEGIPLPGWPGGSALTPNEAAAYQPPHRHLTERKIDMLKSKIGAMPPDTALTPKANKLRDESERIRAQHAAAESTARRLNGPGATFEAESTDAEAAVDAAMQGADPGTVGTPAVDRLRTDAANAARSADALATAHDRLQWQLIEEFRDALKSDKYSGREQRDVAAKDYRTALDHFVQARQKYLAAQAVVTFVEKAASSPSDRDPRRTTRRPNSTSTSPTHDTSGIRETDWPGYGFSNVLAALEKEIDNDTT